MIGVTAAIMNGADASLSLSGMLKSAFWGAVSGAVTFGIGSCFTVAATGANTAFASSLQSAKFLVQAAAHGIAQGAMAMVQWQWCNREALVAAGGFFGSLGATAWSAGAGKFARSGAGTIAFGALSGGVGAELTGGNFWQGAVTGGIVAGLNDVMHRRRSLMSKFKKDKNGNYIVSPTAKPNFTQNGIKTINGAVDGLENAYEIAGSPTVDFEEGQDVASTVSGKVSLNPSQIDTNYELAGTLFHEYRHAFQYSVAYMGYANRVAAWGKLYGEGVNINGNIEGGKWDMMELDAYGEQYRMGDNTYTDRLNKYYNHMTYYWKR